MYLRGFPTGDLDLWSRWVPQSTPHSVFKHLVINIAFYLKDLELWALSQREIDPVGTSK